MKHKLVLLLYLSGLISVAISIMQTVPYKYNLVMKLMTWSDAQNYCRIMYTDLATIVNATDWLNLEKEAASKNYTGPAWIGLYNDVDNWHWSLNNIPLTVTYTNWGPWSYTYAGKTACTFIGENYYWWDVLCEQLYPFICYNALGSGSNRFVGSSSIYLNWSDAQVYCRTHYTDLASSLTSADNTMLAQIRDIQGDSWIGLYRDTWKWSYGTVSDFPWAPGQITSYYSTLNCAMASNGQFSQETCTNPHYFYCFQLKREQQIMRLQVASDASVFDPAVQSVILEQIKQKLEENGKLESITVTWRVQPSGNVFYKKKKE